MKLNFDTKTAHRHVPKAEFELIARAMAAVKYLL
jgi:hypothetical protein